MSGLVHLVGAGPGDPGLLTVAGRRALEEADVVVHDRLGTEELLPLCRPGAELIDAGKAPGRAALTQDEINATLVEHGAAGRRVVRLKGGDPFVFGRGGEEAQALAAAGVPYVVVPGITSAIAAPAYAGIPVTHRGVATSFTVVTGHEDPTKPSEQTDWAALAGVPGTLVILMGMGRLAGICDALVAGGRPADEPAGVGPVGHDAAPAQPGRDARHARGAGRGGGPGVAGRRRGGAGRGAGARDRLARRAAARAHGRRHARARPGQRALRAPARPRRGRGRAARHPHRRPCPPRPRTTPRSSGWPATG